MLGEMVLKLLDNCAAKVDSKDVSCMAALREDKSTCMAQ
jgi:hypothetical protein